MADPLNDETTGLDDHSSELICRAVGEGLRKRLQPDRSALPSHLATLLQQLELQDEQPHLNRQAL